ncbi:hypothetical protein D3C77_407620 [compost metagenome]
MKLSSKMGHKMRAIGKKAIVRILKRFAALRALWLEVAICWLMNRAWKRCWMDRMKCRNARIAGSICCM